MLAFTLEVNAHTIEAALQVTPSQYTWIGEDDVGFWIQSIARTDPSVATLAGLRSWMLANTPSGVGVDVNLALPGTASALQLSLQAAGVNSGGPLSADFFSG